jgi:hypothetical protein
MPATPAPNTATAMRGSPTTIYDEYRMELWNRPQPRSLALYTRTLAPILKTTFAAPCAVSWLCHIWPPIRFAPPREVDEFPLQPGFATRVRQFSAGWRRRCCRQQWRAAIGRQRDGNRCCIFGFCCTFAALNSEAAEEDNEYKRPAKKAAPFKFNTGKIAPELGLQSIAGVKDSAQAAGALPAENASFSVA